ncbi:uncharacterized protein LOC103107560 [Erinaceus europaeus]|uniref:Uncharacterized protein LOC103107560 n=1 Tax=Erinaceus europaeus TaxID=9365 RepID=A0ABM3XW03_ERIEU|nr:uncharacterized protein LOC103107560 [Erinaceus europaeus]
MWEDDPLKRSLESSAEPLEETLKIHDISQDQVKPPVQEKKIHPLPKKHRHVRRTTRGKRVRKSKRKERVETHCPPVHLIPLAPPQSEEDEVVDVQPSLHSAQEGDSEFPNKVKVQRPNEGACVVYQECQIQPYEFSSSPEPGPSSPGMTSLASPSLCFGSFLSCVCQTFSRSKKSTRSEGKKVEAECDPKALRSAILKGVGKNKVEPNQSL